MVAIPLLHGTGQYTYKQETGNMKKSTKKSSLRPKLALRSEIVVSLTPSQLGQVVAGVPDGSVLRGCPSGTLDL
jgi:hypothetical protein